MHGSVDFFRDWNAYKRGFGNLGTEFWLGNDYLHLLTANGKQQLRIDLRDASGNTSYTKYSSFRVSGEQENYKLTFGQFLEGTAGDSLSVHKNMPFSTHDRDNDANRMKNCAALCHAAWWYHDCEESLFDGQYLTDTYENCQAGISWLTAKAYYDYFKITEMKIRAS